MMNQLKYSTLCLLCSFLADPQLILKLFLVLSGFQICIQLCSLPILLLRVLAFEAAPIAR